MLKKVYAFILFLSIAPTVSLAQVAEPYGDSTACQENISNNETESFDRSLSIFLGLEFEKNNDESWKILTDAIQILIEQSQNQTEASILLPLLLNIGRTAVEQGIKPKINLLHYSESITGDLSNFIPEKIVDANTINVAYLIKLGDENFFIWEKIMLTYLETIKSLGNKKTVSESESQEIADSIFALLIDPNNHLNGQIFVHTN